MSIKDLFERSTNYVSDTDQKDAFSDAESSRNVKAISEKQNTFVPQIDYNDPLSFARFGSAELYYEGAIDRIIDFYPYDGSDAEYNEFFNKSLDIEKFIFNNLYPRTNGYVNFSSSSISLKGGPHTIASSTTKGLFKDPYSSQREAANIYDENLYTTEGLPSDYGEGSRESNLKCDYQTGVTIEFWLKNDLLDANTKQALFHLTNSAGGDELTIYVKGDSGSPFFATLRANGSDRFTDERIGVTPDTSSIQQWNHYAVSFKDTGDGISTKFYVNGILDQTKVLGAGTFNPPTQKGIIAHIASGSHDEGHLFFSGSMDEFRFWKTERTAQDIGRNWFGQVRGGTNTDINNTTLGVYYKFNEGITGDSAIDSVVLDYSGRISNGTFNGYTTTSRNTGSAIVSASAATSEYLDPIIYATHPSVSSLKTDLLNKGIDHDSRNGSTFASFMPSWIQEEHEELGNTNFKYLSHIIGSYFDKLYLQIEAVSTFKSPIYTSSSYKPLTFAKHMPSSMGLQTPEIFVDANVMEKFLNRTDYSVFENDLSEVKNLIYLNLYNNIAYLFKSKGTEKAVRNVLRAFNIDDKLVRFNTYANNFTYELENNLKNTVVRKSSVNFNKAQNLGAVIYSSASSDSTQLGHILGSELSVHETRYGITCEADIIFPKFIRLIDPFERDFTRVSLFGIHSASSNLPQTEVFDPSFYVYAQRDEVYSKNVKFVLSSSLLSNEISSSLYHDVYDNENWNLSIRVKPDSVGLTGSVDGVSESDYTIEFSGYNQRLGEMRNAFKITSSASVTANVQNFLTSSKRIFAGAHRTNVTGALQHQTDVLVTATRYWTKRLDDDSLKQHALDFENYGVSDANRHLSPLDSDNDKTLNIHTLALNYEFANVTASDGTGGFTITDISSGSVDGINGSYGMLGKISSYLYPGVGFGFQENANDVVLKQEVNSHQFINPELAISDNLVQIRTDDDKLFDSVDTIPNYHHVLEKSMYNAISEEMLNFFAGVNDFHNLIGHPVHQYRMNYKGLEKLREIFFRRVTKVTEVEKFVEYYKWFDDSVSEIIGQLVPASAEYTPDILNTIESHVLERNKYQHKLPFVAMTSSTEGVVFGSEELRYNWALNHAPVSGLQRDNSNWWKERAERAGIISSGDDDTDKQRNQIRRVIGNDTNGDVQRSFTSAGVKYKRSNFKYRTISKGFIFENKIINEIKGGVNFDHDKNIHYTYAALHPAGPVNTENNVFVPRNVLVGFTEDLVALEDTSDPPENPSSKVKRNILVQHGRDWEYGLGYKNVNSSLAFPFNIVSSSVRSGYNAEVIARATASIEITNLHNDVYGPDMERPMQGPFTNYAVGGHQSRHVKLNKGSDNYLNRPEAWKILLGRCVGVTGAIGMVGADYPHPEANAIGENPYPMTGAQKAVFFRDELAKRPVNIRNIKHMTGSTVLGNYEHNYQVVHTVGGHSNPRAFIDEQPTLPAIAEGADVVKTILDLERGQNSHFTFVDDYNDGYLTGSGEYKNKTVIVNRFSAPGSIESMTNAFKDFRSGDMSVYNAVPFRNMTVRRPFQGVTSSIVSQDTGIRNFDHTGRAFGLANLAARHATRFYRDSHVQNDTDFPNVPRNTPDLNSPGKADDAFTEAPSFHKTHRNNLLKIRNAFNMSASFAGDFLGNSKKLEFNTSVTGSSAINRNSSMAVGLIEDLTSSLGNGLSFSSWIQAKADGDSNGTKRTIYSIGKVEHSDGGDRPLIEFGYEKNTPNCNLYVEIATTDGGGDRTARFTASIAPSSLYSAGPNHLVVGFSGKSGSMDLTHSARFYFNGLELSTGTVIVPKEQFDTSFSPNYNFRGTSLTRNGTEIFAVGGRSSTNSVALDREFSGSIDQLTIWKKVLSQDDVNSLYSSGTPMIITGSNPYLVSSSVLLSWHPLGEQGGDAVNASNPVQFLSGTNSIFTSFASGSNPNIADLFTVSANDSGSSNFFSDTDLVGQTPVQTGFVEVQTEECYQLYDNLNVQHQIPRSDRQYSWFAHSITHTDVCEPRYSGFMQLNSTVSPYYEITGNYYPFFDYVSGSTTTINGTFQNTTRLNLLCHDATGSEINTLGATLITSGLEDVGSNPLEFNALMIHRGDTYGWNWRAFRQQDHPILHREHKESIITVDKNNTIKEFRLPPVSFQGRPVIVNMDLDGENISVKTTHNNEKIYFNQRELNDLVFEKQDPTITPLDELIEISQQSGSQLNWIHYSEAIFPSARNQFVSSSRERLGYDNKFWRDSPNARVTLGSTFNNSFGMDVEQSAWALDPQEDFLTRTDVVSVSGSITIAGFKRPGFYTQLANGGKAGELQNNYFLYVTGTYKESFVAASKTLTNELIVGVQRPGALYSRKHLLNSPNSVVSRAGFAKTGSLTDTFTDEIKIGGGEALWEAGTQATINVKTGSLFATSSFASQPWFDEYKTFKEDLQLVARDYAIIPEFRISEHIEEYVKGGTLNKFNFDTFEIPGTSISSSQQNFYKDYSNSEFLKEFADMQNKSQLTPSEIMLTCKAAVRFNPYKGFYPMQRTLDLVSQFSSSFGKGIRSIYVSGSDSKFATSGAVGVDTFSDGSSRPLIQPLFAPGILYNSIKSGIAVDYPVVTNPAKIGTFNFTGSNSDTDNYMLIPLTSSILNNDDYNPNRPFWDLRVPFETMIEPGKYINNIEFVDYEPNPTASINATASLDTSVSDGVYELMAKNFFGQTGEFFLQNSSYTKIKSDLIQDGLKFNDGDVFAARLKIRKSHNGQRFYNEERGSDGANTYFTNLGALATDSTGSNVVELQGYFPIPQDPAHNSGFKETFTMYSRPSAFGPAVSGRNSRPASAPADEYPAAFSSGTLDSLEGFNWSYTPPYYHGESWVDFIFRPDSDKTYTLEDILTETEAVYRRVDPGRIISGNDDSEGLYSYQSQRALIETGFDADGLFAGQQAIYGGSVVNKNAMQLDSCLNLFGVERVPKKRKDKFGNTILDQNELAGKRWVIQPKWETPMLNFAGVSEENNNITYPTSFSESVPRGIWHQFGVIPTEPDTGIFLEIGDIPTNWLRFHYDVINMSSSYNNNDPQGSGSNAYKNYQSLSELFGFQRSQKKDSAKVRLGEIADKREVYEAVVAIPYIVEASEDYDNSKTDDNKNRKKFISIPRQRFASALKEREGSKDGDSLEVAGESIRKMVQKMKRYVLPPQFDFINFDEIDPIVMYFFEFKYEFDKDDLSYIWQNLAPRDYKKITFQEARVAHDLMNNELLDESDIIDNPNLRWMVFKVKQKAKKDYYDLIPPQIKAARPTTALDKAETDKDDEYLQFNWPYDYLSFVELVKLEADVLYKNPEEEAE